MYCTVDLPISQSLDSTPLTRAEHFNYLGTEFTKNVIAEKLHVQNRIKKSKTQAAALASIGERYLGFHRQCSVRLFKAFLRPDGYELLFPRLNHQKLPQQNFLFSK
jgi:hypothetical protein